MAADPRAAQRIGFIGLLDDTQPSLATLSRARRNRRAKASFEAFGVEAENVRQIDEGLSRVVTA
jgi:hypothetical protein